jgi:signal transduction histidine kinase
VTLSPFPVDRRDRRQRGFVARLASVLLVVGAVAGAVLWPQLRDDTWLGLVNLATAMLYAAAGAVILDDPGQRSTGWMLILVGVLNAVSWLNEWNSGAGPFLSKVLGYLWVPVVAWAVLRYPRPHLERYERLLVIAIAGWLNIGTIFLTVAARPGWQHPSRSVWHPILIHDLRWYGEVDVVFHAGAAALAVGFLVIAVRRLPGDHGVDRAVLTPVAVTVWAGAGSMAVVIVALVLPLSSTAVDGLVGGDQIILLTVPATFLLAAVRRWLARGAVADLALDLAQPMTMEGLEVALRRALKDPTLDIAYWVPDAGTYVDLHGHTTEPAAGGGRLVVPVNTSAGQPLAVVQCDQALDRYGMLVDAAVSVSGMALENARLQAKVRAQLEQVRLSRQRIVQAGVAERRRIERDLHDGAQQRLLALAARLGSAHAQPLGPATLDAIERARLEVLITLAELRDLAHGILPAVLTQAGLAPAVETITCGLPLPVNLRIPGQRMDAAVEVTAYFVISEALSNVVKHADARTATVHVDLEAAAVTVNVSDDGHGGADPTGPGLAGLADRLGALGGQLTITSPVNRGTQLTARIPCE